MREQIPDRDREVVIRIHEAADGVTMPWRSASGSLANATLIRILQRHESGHRVRARAIHPDLAVVIDRHEREASDPARVHDGRFQAVDVVDRLPVRKRGAAKRIDAQREAAADRIASMSTTLARSRT